MVEDAAALALALTAAGLLGFRHATDPDHVTAVVTLATAEGRTQTRTAGLLGLAWGLGHAFTLLAFGVPILVLDARLPARLEAGAEAAIGILIIALALRLLRRWRAGGFHVHEHEHKGIRHTHIHSHGCTAGHAHTHGSRTPLGGFVIGLVHGIGGSAGITLVLLATIESHAVGIAALATLALGAAAAMALLSSGFGLALGHRPLARHLHAVAPAVGLGSLAFGTWYGLGTLHVLPYPL